jgi:hypothetical protein
MTAEDIIQRLLDERKITVKEALILLKAIAGIVVDDWIGRFKKLVDESNKKPEEKKNTPDPYPWIGRDIVVCYGVQNVEYSASPNTIQTWTGDSACLEQIVTKDNDNAVFCDNQHEITTAYGVSSSAYTINPSGSYDASIKASDYSTKKKRVH